jgi:hypothetical protein
MSAATEAAYALDGRAEARGAGGRGGTTALTVRTNAVCGAGAAGDDQQQRQADQEPVRHRAHDARNALVGEYRATVMHAWSDAL